MELIPVFIYGLFLTFILLYSIVELYLVIRFAFRKQVKSFPDPVEWPMVTIQLPLYNEKYVAERLLRQVAAMDYPKDKLEIQLLDDSTDETVELMCALSEEFRKKGFLITHLQRENRIGYKAGALAYGLSLAKGEFIAIFDADFLPPVDFLKKSIPFFQQENVGVVQGRWGHLNKNYSLLTRLQAFALDAHFSIEQNGRKAGNHFINFNGTAGVWRKECIEKSGGWQSDTLTEDLDLSYRAQLCGWKFIYRNELDCPAELPPEMNALNAQQFRWSKGAAECARKNLGKVLRNKEISLGTKVISVFHLLNSFLFICVFAIGVLSIPVILIVHQYPEHQSVYSWMFIYYFGLFFISVFYLISELSISKQKIKSLFQFLYLFPLFLSVSLGMSLYNALGVVEGYLGKKSAFVRTPKFGIRGNSGKWTGSAYRLHHIPLIVWLEGLFMLVFGAGFLMALCLQNYLSLPFFLMLCFGFAFVFFTSVIHYSRK